MEVATARVPFAALGGNDIDGETGGSPSEGVRVLRGGSSPLVSVQVVAALLSVTFPSVAVA